jgi:hypothetical protein
VPGFKWNRLNVSGAPLPAIKTDISNLKWQESSSPREINDNSAQFLGRNSNKHAKKGNY